VEGRLFPSSFFSCVDFPVIQVPYVCSVQLCLKSELSLCSSLVNPSVSSSSGSNVYAFCNVTLPLLTTSLETKFSYANNI
jgi:hypothetical protein